MSDVDVPQSHCGNDYCIRYLTEGCYSCMVEMEHQEIQAEAELQDELDGRYVQ